MTDNERQQVDRLVYGNSYTHITPEGEQRIDPREVTPIMAQADKREPLSEAELARYEEQVRNNIENGYVATHIPVLRLIATIRALQEENKALEFDVQSYRAAITKLVGVCKGMGEMSPEIEHEVGVIEYSLALDIQAKEG